MVDPGRIYRFNDLRPSRGPVVYWMSRDQRLRDNWALLYAQEIALETGQPLVVAFTLADSFLGAGPIHYRFMLNGLQLLEKDLARLNISLFILEGDPVRSILRFTKENLAGALVTDFSPLRVSLSWKERITREIRIFFAEADAHNIVPCRFVSGKQEYGARTIRPKIEKLIPRFLTSLPQVKAHPHAFGRPVPATDWNRLLGRFSAGAAQAENWPAPGEKEAGNLIRRFIRNKLGDYSVLRNDPSRDCQSGLSPYIHFGQVSAHRVALHVESSGADIKSRESFIEELIVRRELADNYCLYNPGYDSFSGFPEWSRKTLGMHRDDERDYIYTPAEFEAASTHDKIWNAAQIELVRKGKIHGYMRMYWAKKILEWTPSPEEAMETAVWLNDRYGLDGRDPNGYAGIAWSIGGVHDRPWFERPVFGKVRYMSENGIRNKFDIDSYIRRSDRSEP